MLSWLTEMRGIDEKVYPLGEGAAPEAGWIGLGLVQELRLLPPSVGGLWAAPTSQKQDVGAPSVVC